MKMSWKNNINVVTFFNLLGPIFLNGISFFTIPIFTRLLGTENYGIVTIYTTWLQVLTIVISLQITATIGNASILFTEEEQSKYYSSSMSLVLLSATIFSFLIIVFRNNLAQFTELPTLLVCLMPFHALGTIGVNFSTSKFTYFKQGYKTFLVSVLTTLFSIFLSLLLIKRIPQTNYRYVGRILGFAAPNLLIGFLFLAFYLVKGKTFYNKKFWGFCISFSLPLVFHALSQIVLSQCDKIMLQKYLDNSAVGVYGFTVTFTQILSIIYNALNSTWVPFFYEDTKKELYEKIEKRQKNYIYLFTGLTIGFLLVSQEVIKLLAPSAYWGATSLIPVMVFSIFIVFLYSFPVNFQFYYRNTKMIAAGTLFAALINILFNSILIPRLGMLGAAIGTLIAYIALFTVHLLIAKYYIKETFVFPVKYAAQSTTAVVLCIFIYTVTVNMPILRWALAAGVGVLLLRRIIKNRSIF
ncbi:Polysaccharide biosynthesis protein [Anaerotruncus sp. 2789STDY5834896]|uniref:Polysaccharide biosynthesis protein n=1 Tax=uncultured Anaerotruncus sp. TaxID=905011 RepID=A0A1C6JD77_9FIRM|nr:Polysaccharide biosynthesis protein [uncultured Anaerotruncus sp.]